MKRTALVTGITGQVGPYMAKLLLDKGYEVYGVMRRVSHEHLDFIKEFGLQSMHLIEGDLTDQSNLMEIIDRVQPDEVYNFAAQSHVGTSFDQPELTGDVTGMGVLRLLEAIRKNSPRTKFYQASSSEMFGDVIDAIQTETSVFRPQSPYAVAKLYGHYLVRVYREAYGIYACSGITFNTESPRRGKRFVTRKITNWLGEYTKDPSVDPLELGYIDSCRDWGFAGDYVQAIWLMMQQPEPDDYILATNETHSVREFCNIAFARVGINLTWEGEELDELGKDQYGNILVKINPEYYRPAEVPLLCGDPSRTMGKLNWSPTTKFIDLVHMMVDSDVSAEYVFSKD